MRNARTCYISDDQCTTDGHCYTLPDGRVVCNTHYQRWYRLGDPEAVTRKKTPKKEIEAWVARLLAADDDECWPWPFRRQATRSVNYGDIGVWRGTTAPRALLRLAKGDPPDESYVACHKPECTEKPLCVNPNHLYWGTQLRNMADKVVDGTWIHGSRVWTAAVSDDVAQAIWNASGTRDSIGLRFGVTRHVVNGIKEGRTYPGVDRSKPAGSGKHASRLNDEMGKAIIPDPRPQLTIAREWKIGVATVNGIKHGTLLPHLDRTNVVIHQRGGPERKLDDQKSQAIIDDGRTNNVIAEDYGVSEHTVWALKHGHVRKHLDRTNVVIHEPARPKGISGAVTKGHKLDIEKAQAIYDDGRKTKEIATAFGVSEGMVQRIKAGKSWKNIDRSKPPGWRGRPEERGAA